MLRRNENLCMSVTEYITLPEQQSLVREPLGAPAVAVTDESCQLWMNKFPHVSHPQHRS